MTAMTPLLSLHGLNMRFGGLMALSDVYFDVVQGEILGLIGPNGAGKTTVFNCITGVYAPTGGDLILQHQGSSLRCNGRKPEQMTALGVTRTFQNIRLFNSLSVLDNVRLGRHCRSRSSLLGVLLHTRKQQEEERRIVDEAMRWIDFVGLRRRTLDEARSLPYGDQRRLEIARALATEPKVLLLDEPAAGMNPSETRQLEQLIHAILEMGVTIVLIEHDMKMVMRICKRLVVLDHGVKIAEGPPEEIKENPSVIEAYLGRGAAGA